MAALHSLDALEPRALDLPGAAGCVLWILLCVVALKKASDDDLPGLSLAVILVNLACEALAARVFPGAQALRHALDGGWIVIAAASLWQLVRRGPAMIRALWALFTRKSAPPASDEDAPDTWDDEARDTDPDAIPATLRVPVFPSGVVQRMTRAETMVFPKVAVGDR